MGVQAALDAAAQSGKRLARALELLSARHSQRASDVSACLAQLYHTLSKEFHGTGNRARLAIAPSTTGRGAALPSRHAQPVRVRERGCRRHRQVAVREADFPAPAERLALCAVLETFNVKYEYWDEFGVNIASPYELLPSERTQLISLPEA